METTEANEYVDVKIVCEETVHYEQIVRIEKCEFERLRRGLDDTAEIFVQIQAHRKIESMIDRSDRDETEDFYISEFAINEEK